MDETKSCSANVQIDSLEWQLSNNGTKPMAFANIERFLEYHANNKERDRLRLGQRFCNLYIKQPWPELFYDVSEHSALQRILTYLADHQYVNAMPPEIDAWL